ncbi:MAG TPA: hypothetical protein VK395_18825 [Gemmataceae bacterium]|nr:hypothetical protein [Gemmataceae bacterium]
MFMNPLSRRTGWKQRPCSSQKNRWRARAGLIWGLLFFASFQLGMTLYMDYCRPELQDPEYGQKLALLRARLQKQEKRPLILVLGSSRSELGIRPEALPPLHVDGETPLVFNFALTGSGPVMELLCLRKLLAAGIHPTQLIVEVLPPLLHQEGAWAEENWLNIDRLSIRDLLMLRRFWQHPGSSLLQGIQSRLVPWFSNRYIIMSRFAPCWLTWETRQDDWGAIGSSGWLPYHHPVVDAKEYQHGLEFAHKQYAPGLNQFHVSEVPDRALQELLDLCRVEHIAATLLLMPEGRDFQSWYSPAVREEIDCYLAEVGVHYAVPIIDARSWMEDGAFFDSHHLLPSGATIFTQRLGREALQPLLEANGILARGNW